MPSLKDLTCSIELPAKKRKLQEFGTFYGDGSVETFVAVPKSPQPFAVRLSSRNFIAPGLAMYVFIDGVYQCNRNRQDLKPRKPDDNRSVVNFCVRQKEEKQKDGSLIARDWAFEKLDIATANDAPKICSANTLDNNGCIEVIVLRCTGIRDSKSAFSKDTKASNMNMDGAGDVSDYYFGLDGNSTINGHSQGQPIYDDRSVHFGGHRIPMRPPSDNSRPPPPISYQAPYAQTAYSHEEPVQSPYRVRNGSTHASQRSYSQVQRSGNDRIPPSGYEYGVGPIPREDFAETQHRVHHGRSPSRISAAKPLVDPEWLDHVVSNAVKRGVEQAKLKEKESLVNEGRPRSEANLTYQLPGGWPSSPFGPTTAPPQQTAFSGQVGGQNAWEKAEKSHGWTSDPAHGKSQKLNEWGSPQETSSDSWDNDETWETNGHKDDSGMRDEWGDDASSWGSCPSSPPVPPTVADPTTDRHRSESRREGKSQRAKTDLQTTTSNDGWTFISAPSDSASLLSFPSSTVFPAHSRSQISSRRSDHDKRSHRSEVAENEASAASSQVALSQKSYHGPLATDTIPPKPTWGGAVSHRSRKHNTRAPPTPPPFATEFQSFVGSSNRKQKDPNNSSSSSSWGLGEKSKESSEQAAREQLSSWGDDGFDDKKSRKSSKAETCKGWNVDNTGDEWAWDNDNDEVGRKSLGKGWEDTDWNHDDENDGWGAKTNGWDDDLTENKQKASWENDKKNETRGQARSRAGSKASDKGFETGWDNNNGWNWDDDPSEDKQKARWKDDQKSETKSKARSKAGSKRSDAGSKAGWDNDNNNWTWDDNAKAGFVDSGWDGPAAQTNNGWDAQNDNNPWTADSPTHKSKKAQSANDNQPFSKPPPEPKDKKSHPSKSRHTPPNTTVVASAIPPIPKDHWKFPPSSLPAKKLHSIPENSAKHAAEGGSKKLGKGMIYGHAVGRPEYVDSFDKPYAIFRFKYRSLATLHSLFSAADLAEKEEEKESTSAPPPSLLLPSQQQPPTKQTLATTPRAQLIDSLLSLHAKVNEKGGGAAVVGDDKDKEEKKSHAALSMAQKEMTERWVERQQSATSSAAARSARSGGGGGSRREKVVEVGSVRGLTGAAVGAGGWGEGLKEASSGGNAGEGGWDWDTGGGDGGWTGGEGGGGAEGNW